MEYRELEKLGIKTSLLGFGCMRFPKHRNGKVNEEKAEEMLDTAYKNGVNYYDTAYIYHDGESERITGHILNKYDRASYYLATKLPVWLVQTLEDAKRIFEDQLKRLDKDYIDFYLLHALNKNEFDRIAKLGVIEYCEELKAAGKIKYFGFSFHDDFSAFSHIIQYRNWDFCQIQYNYMDRNIQAGDKGYELAKQLGIPLIIMEPVKGGTLAKLPKGALKYFNEINPDLSSASFALRWVAAHPNVKVILSGMSNMEQVKDNIENFSPYVPLNQEEMLVINKVGEYLLKRVNNGCTGCSYCMPCPVGVDIPGNFRVWNDYGMYRNKAETGWHWNQGMEEKAKAKNCIECGKCEKVCPQQISIRIDLKKLQKELDTVK